jgi:hypothetical protein
MGIQNINEYLYKQLSKKIKEPPLVDIELSHLVLDHVVTVDNLNPEEIVLNCSRRRR